MGFTLVKPVVTEEPDLNVEGIRVNSLEDYLEYSEKVEEPFGGY